MDQYEVPAMLYVRIQSEFLQPRKSILEFLAELLCKVSIKWICSDLVVNAGMISQLCRNCGQIPNLVHHHLSCAVV